MAQKHSKRQRYVCIRPAYSEHCYGKTDETAEIVKTATGGGGESHLYTSKKFYIFCCNQHTTRLKHTQTVTTPYLTLHTTTANTIPLLPQYSPGLRNPRHSPPARSTRTIPAGHRSASCCYITAYTVTKSKCMFTRHPYYVCICPATVNELTAGCHVLCTLSQGIARLDLC
jgi:hypothetical protein